ncbi:hypothetical protein [Lacihabitans sp. LS3-19]|uniref:hypothetical protein n=1 Tax=Lacihabitans sp. LS3-19 TaxID=2487335 RepID=UPI0020CDBEE9|nr:hypothetical protein [Lacihabitans sp. LS3-19]
MSQEISKVPSWLMILVYVVILAIFGFCTDLFTFIVGALITTLVFASGYDQTHSHDH